MIDFRMIDGNCDGCGKIRMVGPIWTVVEKFKDPEKDEERKILCDDCMIKKVEGRLETHGVVPEYFTKMFLYVYEYIHGTTEYDKDKARVLFRALQNHYEKLDEKGTPMGKASDELAKKIAKQNEADQKRREAIEREEQERRRREGNK